MVKATRVSQQALSQRLLTFPAELFEKVLAELLVTLNQRWFQRKKRPLPLSVAYAERHFERLWIVDASIRYADSPAKLSANSSSQRHYSAS